eukprot:1155816-Pelagomonas_calceolata.AAC.7
MRVWRAECLMRLGMRPAVSGTTVHQFALMCVLRVGRVGQLHTYPHYVSRFLPPKTLKFMACALGRSQPCALDMRQRRACDSLPRKGLNLYFVCMLERHDRQTALRGLVKQGRQRHEAAINEE